MKTLKTSRQFKGSSISVRAVAGLEGRAPPISILDLVSNDAWRHFNGRISTGDVHCNWRMTVWQNGFWSIYGDFHDDGALAGDFFYVEFLLGGVSVGQRLEGSILNVLDDRSLSLSKDGSDRWIREHWQSFEASGPSVKLHAAPAYGGLAWSALTALGVGALYVFGGGSGATAERCDDQNPDGPACIHGHIGGGEDP